MLVMKRGQGQLGHPLQGVLGPIQRLLESLLGAYSGLFGSTGSSWGAHGEYLLAHGTWLPLESALTTLLIATLTSRYGRDSGFFTL